jgi:hypothetical protein
MSAGKLLACPRCGQAEGLATIEELVGTTRSRALSTSPEN